MSWEGKRRGKKGGVWTAAVLVLAGISWLVSGIPQPGGVGEQSGDGPSAGPVRSGGREASDSRTGPRQTGPYTVSGVTIVDINTGRTLPNDSVDLEPALARIARGEKDRHHNDGSVFGNRSGNLPKKPSGYYREYVVRTPGVSGPGPQRLVLGKGGEIYYTPDHYETFVKLERRRE